MTGRTKLKTREVAAARDILVKKQNRVCPLCNGKLGKGKEPVLDHDHKTGLIRDVLCRNCNGIEGKIYNLMNRAKDKITLEQWLQNLSDYWERHKQPQHGGLLHPTHKTEAEKRLARNKKARERRAKLKKEN